MNVSYHLGNCVDVMTGAFAECSVDSIVCDPPYHLTANKKGGTGAKSNNPDSPAGRARIGTGFMGKVWDGGDVAFRVETWEAALRVAKPGAHLVAFGGTRTHHRMMCAIEDAGWEIRDVLMWLYGSGFPKSLDVSKAIDKAAGSERERIADVRPGHHGPVYAQDAWTTANRGTVLDRSPITEAARVWDGWGTALKPAWEPIILARKPLGQSVAANVQEHGTGALNIDACRIHSDDAPGGEYAVKRLKPGATLNATGGNWRPEDGPEFHGTMKPGRWPANVVLDDDAAALLDSAAPEAGGAAPASGRTLREPTEGGRAYGARNGLDGDPAFYGDSGGASRFFYTSKASRAERNAGLDALPKKNGGSNAKGYTDDVANGHDRNREVANHHPTVKPLDLMQWLCKLVTPRGGVILDPFMGSGTTGRAAVAEGFAFIGIEKEAAYLEIARARIAEYAPLFAETGT